MRWIRPGFRWFHFTVYTPSPDQRHGYWCATRRAATATAGLTRARPSDLQVELRNSGGGHGYNCHAVLRSGDSRFHILDSTSTYGFIRKGDSASNASDLFVVHADASIPLETPVPCTLYAYADGGYVSAPQVFTLVVGQITHD